MIAVRIPEEIRKYKEKIWGGMTARQIIWTVLALVICFAVYWFGKDYISEDAMFFAIILLAAPMLAIGWFSVQGGRLMFGNGGMPMEKYFVVWVKFNMLYPRKRIFHTENAFRQWQNQGYAEEMPKTKKERKQFMEAKKQAALEKAFLIAEAEANGTAKYNSDPEAGPASTYNVDEQELLTVKKKNGGKKPKKDKDKKKKEKKKSPLQIQAEAIEQKRVENPEYVPTKKEYKTLSQWYAKREKLRKQEINQGKKAITKKSKKMEKRRSAKTAVPKYTQQSIPYIADYEEGMFEVTPNKFSKMYRIKDINYRTGKAEDQEIIFCKLGEFLNYFSEEMRFSIVLDNRYVSKEEQERKVFKRMKGDKYDRHRREYNRILRRQIIAGRNDMQMQKYITVTIDADTPIEALLRFHKIDAEIISNLRRIGSDGEVLSTDERLEYYHDKFRKGHEGEFQIDYDFIKKQGISSKDYIAPSFMRFDNKYIQIDDEYYRCMFLNNLPASMTDDLLFDLSDNDFPETISLSIEPVAQDKGIRIVQKQLTGIEKDKMDAERKAIRSGYNPDSIKHEIKDAHAQAESMYDDMMNKNQKMFFVSITVMVHGSSLEELDENCKIVMSKARAKQTQLQVLTTQQEEAFRMTLPFGYVSKELSVERTLTTESTCIFMPFSNQELFQSGGFYYGLNQISQNLIIVNRDKMKSPSGFLLGSSGSGKSFACKREIIEVLLEDEKTNVLIIDPEDEYGDFCRAFGGTVLKISADSTNYINPMDMSKEYGLDEDDDIDNTPLAVMKTKALKKKSEYILSIVERMISVGGNGDTSTITARQKTIVDRAVRETYREYLDHDFDPDYQPTLLDLQDQLDVEGTKSEEGLDIAEGVAYYTRGSMDVFAHKTNVNISNRFVVFNVRDLGDQLRQIAMVIVFDFIWNRMVQNRSKGIRTRCYCDEIHTMFQSYYSADFLKNLFKRGRKFGLCITGITQDVEELLRSEQARLMVSNSHFIMMLNQSYENLKILATMLNISETQMTYVTAADEGCGLLFAEKTIVPFVDRFPTDSYLYKLMTTKFGEDLPRSEVDKMIAEIMGNDKVETQKAG